MAQQTQAATCIPYYERWLKKWPTVHDLAQATEDEVRALWQGLGYYSRATRLLAGAQKVVKDYDGILPEDPRVLEKEVPGIGPYTAGAIASMAYQQRVPAVDGNVQRTYSRIFAIHANPAAKETVNHLQKLAEATMPKSRPGDYNQALMDLGYFICSPKPDCSKCPISKHCMAKLQSAYRKRDVLDIEQVDEKKQCTTCDPFEDAPTTIEVTRYPMPKIKKKAREEETALVILEWQSNNATDEKDAHYLITQRPESGLLAGLFEFPTVDMLDLDSESIQIEALSKCVSSILGLKQFDIDSDKMQGKGIQVQSVARQPSLKHKFSHIAREYFPVHVLFSSPTLPQLVNNRARWVPKANISSLNMPTAVSKIWLAHTSDVKINKRKPKSNIKQKLISSQQKSVSCYFSKTEASASSNHVTNLNQEEVDEVILISSPRKKRRIQDSDDEES